MENKRLYFVSDVHLGIAPESKRIERERVFVKWLDSVKNDAQAIYLLGDIFDIWYEFSKVAPKGFVRVLGKIAEITDTGIPVHFFRGNHDGWHYRYLCEETGMTPHSKEEVVEFNGHRLMVGHGDGVGDHENSYLLMKWFLNSRFTKCLMKHIFRPAWTLGICQSVSRRNRLAKGITVPFKGPEKESQLQFCKRILSKDKKIDCFIFGHRHLAINMKLSSECRYICLGEWINACTYAIVEPDGTVSLKSFSNRNDLISEY